MKEERKRINNMDLDAQKEAVVIKNLTKVSIYQVFVINSSILIHHCQLVSVLT